MRAPAGFYFGICQIDSHECCHGMAPIMVGIISIEQLSIEGKVSSIIFVNDIGWCYRSTPAML